MRNIFLSFTGETITQPRRLNCTRSRLRAERWGYVPESRNV